MSEFFEMLMVIFFGISWPLNILKSVKAGTAKGKSLPFLLFILIGYLFGIASKIISGNITYVFFFYILNFCMVSVDCALYFRNRARDISREKER